MMTTAFPCRAQSLFSIRLALMGTRGAMSAPFVTDSNGKYVLEGRSVNNSNTTGVLQYDHLYELVEIEAPDGYERSQTTVLFIFPWFVNGVMMTTESQNLLSEIRSNGLTPKVFMAETTGNMTVSNTKILKVSVHVAKLWKNEDNSDYAGATPPVTVQLLQDNVKDGDPVTLDSANNYAYDFTNLPRSDTNSHVVLTTPLWKPRCRISCLRA